MFGILRWQVQALYNAVQLANDDGNPGWFLRIDRQAAKTYILRSIESGCPIPPAAPAVSGIANEAVFPGV